jgi:metal-sulfur cluster biosynthetic enzyme
MGVDPRMVEQVVIHQLQQVIDPETGVDVVRMRLIEDLTVDETGTVHYRFRPACAAIVARRRCVPSP